MPGKLKFSGGDLLAYLANHPTRDYITLEM